MGGGQWAERVLSVHHLRIGVPDAAAALGWWLRVGYNAEGVT